jgi:hypothetical protein
MATKKIQNAVPMGALGGGATYAGDAELFANYINRLCQYIGQSGTDPCGELQQQNNAGDDDFLPFVPSSLSTSQSFQPTGGSHTCNQDPFPELVNALLQKYGTQQGAPQPDGCGAGGANLEHLLKQFAKDLAEELKEQFDAKNGGKPPVPTPKPPPIPTDIPPPPPKPKPPVPTPKPPPIPVDIPPPLPKPKPPPIPVDIPPPVPKPKPPVPAPKPPVPTGAPRTPVPKELRLPPGQNPTVPTKTGAQALDKWDAQFQAASRSTGLPANYIKAVAWAESRGNAGEFSHNPDGSHDDLGVMQISDYTYSDVMKDQPNAPRGLHANKASDNIMMGAWELRDKFSRQGQNQSYVKTSAAYRGVGDGADTSYANAVVQFWLDINHGKKPNDSGRW